jgi:hypothetical protein
MDTVSSPTAARADHIPQLHHRAADARLDRPERLVETLCDVRLGHRGKEREFTYLEQVLRELLKRLAYQLARLHRRDRIEGTLAIELLENFRLAMHVVLEPIAALCRAQTIHGLVASERHRPGQRFTEGRIIKGRLFPDLEEDILQHVLGGYLIQHAISRGKQEDRKPIVKLLETTAVALTDPFRKLDLGFAFFGLIRFHTVFKRIIATGLRCEAVSRRPSAKQNELLRYSVTR